MGFPALQRIWESTVVLFFSCLCLNDCGEEVAVSKILPSCDARMGRGPGVCLLRCTVAGLWPGLSVPRHQLCHNSKAPLLPLSCSPSSPALCSTVSILAARGEALGLLWGMWSIMCWQGPWGSSSRSSVLAALHGVAMPVGMLVIAQPCPGALCCCLHLATGRMHAR